MIRKLLIAVCGFCFVCMGHASEFKKVLFIGNSITLHGPSKKIGWDGNWGMAASSKDKDYVHLVTKALTEKSGYAPEIMVKNVATFERQHPTYDTTDLVKETKTFSPDLIIVAIGENVPALKTDESKDVFAEKVEKLLKDIRADKSPVILVRSCFWANGPKDAALKKACQAVGGIYVDMSNLSKDESNFARSERSFQHKGVAGHPGDKGMQAIADGIMRGLKFSDVAAKTK